MSQSGVRKLGYLCHHTYQAMGEGCPLEARGPPNLLAPQCIGKGGSSSLRETGVQALGRESTLEALCTKTAQGSEGMWAESGHSRPQSHLQSPSLQAPLHTHHCRGPSQPNSSSLLLSSKSCLNYPHPPWLQRKSSFLSLPLKVSTSCTPTPTPHFIALLTEWSSVPAHTLSHCLDFVQVVTFCCRALPGVPS